MKKKIIPGAQFVQAWLADIARALALSIPAVYLRGRGHASAETLNALIERSGAK
jgi:hypothetical protein